MGCPLPGTLLFSVPPHTAGQNPRDREHTNCRWCCVICNRSRDQGAPSYLEAVCPKLSRHCTAWISACWVHSPLSISYCLITHPCGNGRETTEWQIPRNLTQTIVLNSSQRHYYTNFRLFIKDLSFETRNCWIVQAVLWLFIVPWL